jgi:hypothetical protein
LSPVAAQATASGHAVAVSGTPPVLALLAVGTTPAQAEKALEAPLHALSRGVYKLDREYDFNVLDEVYYDAGSHQISLVGHRDEHFKGLPIPYLDHLATLLGNPNPRFTLNLTPDSYRRASAFFHWSPTRQQAEKFNKDLYGVIDPRGNITPIGRYMLPSFGIYPVRGNKKPGYLGVETHLTKDGMTAVTRVAPNSPAAKAGIIAGDWITFFDDGPIVSPTDRPVYLPQDLAHRVRFAGAGTTLNVTYQRSFQAYKKSVTLTADSKDPWLGVTRYDLLAALYRAAGDERAARTIEAIGLLKDSPMGNPVLGRTLANFSAVLNMSPQSTPEGRGQAISRRLDEIFAFPGNPVLNAYNVSFAMTRNAAAAIHPALARMDAALVPKVLELLERPQNQPGGFQIPPEVVDRLWNVHAEMIPEYRDVPADSLLARTMFESDYLTKRLTNRPDLKLKFPAYQTEFEYRRTHGLNKDDGVFRTWISVAKLDVAQSSSGDTLELRDVQMRYNIHKLGKNGIDLPNQEPSGYADLLTSLYNDFEREYPSLHELREIAKLTAAAAWLHGKTPSLRLPQDGAVKWRGPAKVPGLAYTYLYNRDRKLFYQMLVEGGVNLNLQPFLWPSTGVVDARGTPGGGALPHGAPLIPISPSIVDLRVSDGGSLTAPPDGYRSVGWVVRTDASHGARQSVSLTLNPMSEAEAETGLDRADKLRQLNKLFALNERVFSILAADSPDWGMFRRLLSELRGDKNVFNFIIDANVQELTINPARLAALREKVGAFRKQLQSQISAIINDPTSRIVAIKSAPAPATKAPSSAVTPAGTGVFGTHDKVANPDLSDAKSGCMFDGQKNCTERQPQFGRPQSAAQPSWISRLTPSQLQKLTEWSGTLKAMELFKKQQEMRDQYAAKEKDLAELKKNRGTAVDPDADAKINDAQSSLSKAGANLGETQATIETEEKKYVKYVLDQ